VSIFAVSILASGMDWLSQKAASPQSLETPRRPETAEIRKMQKIQADRSSRRAPAFKAPPGCGSGGELGLQQQFHGAYRPVPVLVTILGEPASGRFRGGSTRRVDSASTSRRPVRSSLIHRRSLSIGRLLVRDSTPRPELGEGGSPARSSSRASP